MPVEKTKAAKISEEVEATYNRWVKGEETSDFTLKRLERELKELIRQHLATSQVYSDLGGVYCMLGDQEKSENYHQMAVASDPNSPAILLNFATCLAHSGNYRKAYSYAKKSHTFAPDAIGIKQELAAICTILGKYKEALEVIEEYFSLAKEPSQVAVKIKKIASFKLKMKKLTKGKEGKEKSFGSDETYREETDALHDELSHLRFLANTEIIT